MADSNFQELGISVDDVFAAYAKKYEDNFNCQEFEQTSNSRDDSGRI